MFKEESGYLAPIAVYLHWNGGYKNVASWLAYCKMVGFCSPERDTYGFPRLSQIIGNTLDHCKVSTGMSLGLEVLPPELCECLPSEEEIEKYSPGDNGIYIVQNWKIIAHLGSFSEEKDSLTYGELYCRFEEINDCQPWHISEIATRHFLDTHGKDYITEKGSD